MKNRGKNKKFLNRLARDEGGQAIVEYILILSVSIVGAVAIARVVMNALDDGILILGGQLEKDLKSGRAPLSVWKN